MEVIECLLQGCKGVVSVGVIPCDIDKVDQAKSSLEDPQFSNHTNKCANKNPFKLLVVCCSPLLNFGYPILEVAKARENGHHTELYIKVHCASNCADPFFEVVLDETLMKLVEGV